MLTEWVLRDFQLKSLLIQLTPREHEISDEDESGEEVEKDEVKAARTQSVIAEDDQKRSAGGQGNYRIYRNYIRSKFEITARTLRCSY
jgi:hypothetical protein